MLLGVGKASAPSYATNQDAMNNNAPSQGRAHFWSAIGAAIGAFVVGIVAGGVFDGITKAGLPNAVGAVGAVVGAFGGGYLTFRYVNRQRPS